MTEVQHVVPGADVDPEGRLVEQQQAAGGGATRGR